MLATYSKINPLASHNSTETVKKQTTPFTTLSQCSQFSQHQQSQSFLIICTIDITSDAAAVHVCCHLFWKLSWLSFGHIIPCHVLLIVVPHRPPHCTVTLETTAESNLPDPVALPNAFLGLYV